MQEHVSSGVSTFLKRWVITTLAVLVAVNVVPGISYDNWTSLLIATLLLGILNAVVRPIVVILSLPLVILTLGLFMLFINAGLLYLVGHLKGFHVATFGAAFWGSLIISIVSLVLNSLTKSGSARLEFHRNAPPPPAPPRDDDQGPVIDV